MTVGRKSIQSRKSTEAQKKDFVHHPVIISVLRKQRAQLVDTAKKAATRYGNAASAPVSHHPNDL